MSIEKSTFGPDERSATRGARREAVEVSLQAVSFGFGALEVLAGVDLRLPPRGVLGLVGPSGCGKSTMLELVAGLREPDSGAVRVSGATDGPGRLAHCAYMPQRDLLFPWLPAIDNAALALRNRGMGRSEARGRAASLFSRFGLAGFEHARPAQLSGGMRQRIAFLRTLMAGKPVLLLDEPFGALDAITRGEMQEWLAEALLQETRTAIFVTHDVEEALYLCDRVAILSPRPARVVEILDVPAPRAIPRLEAITAPEFATLRERALETLGRAHT